MVSYGKPWLRRVSDLTVRGIDLMKRCFISSLARSRQPESTLVNVAQFVVISIVPFCLNLLMKNTQSTINQNQPESTRCAILISAPTLQDPPADEDICIAVLLNEHMECSICLDTFSIDIGTTEAIIRKCLPIQSKVCHHYFRHGCIQKIQAPKADSNNDVEPERIPCYHCLGEAAFCPSRPNYHWMLIDFL
jgi:hypothetical protein